VIYDLCGQAKLPWWVELPLAAVSYAVLHQFASTSGEKPADIHGLGTFVGKELYRVLAFWFQSILAASFVIGAIASVVSRHKRRTLLRQSPI